MQLYGKAANVCFRIGLFVLSNALFLSASRSFNSNNRSTLLVTSKLYLPNTRSGTPETSESNYSLYFGTDHVPHPSDWMCESVNHWLDLGPFYFPRFVKQSICTSNHCFGGYYNCLPQHYQLRVLRLKDNEMSEEEISLPPQLRQNWMFDNVQVSVGCACSS